MKINKKKCHARHAPESNLHQRRRRSPNSNFMKKRILIVLYLLYILIINHTFIIANRVTLLK